eukprot:TRINITY_DN614_c0_g2_i14.p1 TRINITY_DN614_c0_g2~~TRINITY_DN614_c0_g2_i14.p1  ORF type:complete len:580 (+),score=298.81 TRINITY_DN614_c0_g2_i14:75-1814(+)
MALYLLYEHASGYALFERKESEQITAMTPEIQQAQTEYSRFSKMVHMKAFVPFTSAEAALQNMNDVSEGVLNDTLKNFLETQLGKGKPEKLTKFTVGVSDHKIGQAIQDDLFIKCVSDELILELLRGIRYHLSHFLPDLRKGDLEKAQLGLAHAYSRAKVKFNVHRVDNMVIQSIALVDQLDKDLNTFAMRIREWYSWHFPELVRIVNDNYQFARLAKLIKRRSNINEEMIPAITEIVGDDADKAREVVEAAKSSMGTDVSDIDMINIESFATRVISLQEYRKQLHSYMVAKMQSCAPNLCALIGESVGARLISHAGSLVNLAKYPASTIQILGAEKALFRALKTKGNTPKYGLIFHSSFIGRAAPKNKGRISRYLANKCAIAARIDCFSDIPTSKFGEKLKQQVEERLSFYETGVTPRRNIEVMKEVMEEVQKEAAAIAEAEAKQKKRKPAAADDAKMEIETVSNGDEGKKKKKKNKEVAAAVEEKVVEEVPEKKKKKEKKAEVTPMEEDTPAPVEPEKKKKKKKEAVVEEVVEEPAPVETEKKKKKKKEAEAPAPAPVEETSEKKKKKKEKKKDNDD